MQDRVPPQNIEAEQSVLGAMLIEKEAIPKVMEILRDTDFYREAHRVIFNAMLELYNKNERNLSCEYYRRKIDSASAGFRIDANRFDGL